MAQVIVTIKIMPDSPEIEFEGIKEASIKEITAFCGETETKTEEEPIAFGLKALKILFVMDEDKGSTEELEKKVALIEGVNSVEVVDVRRAIG